MPSYLRQSLSGAARDIHNSLVSHLLEGGSNDNRRADDFARRAYLKLVENFKVALLDKQARNDLKAWILPLADEPVAGRQNGSEPFAIRERISRQLDTECEEVDDLIANLLGVGIAKVDMVNTTAYYVDLYHKLLPIETLTSIYRRARVPLFEGIVGHAARRTGMSVENTQADTRLNVGDDDLLLGNVSEMLVGIGLQNLSVAEDQPYLPPNSRWQCQGRTWRDGFDKDVNTFGAIVFCFFPLAKAFPNLDSLSPNRSDESEVLFGLFEHICKSREHSVLAQLQYEENEFSTRVDDGTDTALDMLASNTSRNNPTGGLMLIRRRQPEDTNKRPPLFAPNIRISVPYVERNLLDNLDWTGSVFRSWLETGSTERRISSPALSGEIAAALHGNLQRVLIADPKEEDLPLVQLVLHGLPQQDIGWPTPVVQLDAIQKFFTHVNDHYFRQLNKAYIDRNPLDFPTGRFENGKLIIDVCKSICRILAERLCLGPTDDDGSDHAVRISKLVELGLRRLGLRRLNEDLNAVDSIRWIRQSLQTLDILADGLRGKLLAVSSWYFAPHNIAETDASGKILQQPPPYSDILPTLDQRRRAFVMAFFRAERRPSQLDRMYDATGDRWLTVERCPDEHEMVAQETLLKFKVVYCQRNGEEASYDSYWKVSAEYRSGIVINQNGLEELVKSQIVNWSQPEFEQIVQEVLDCFGSHDAGKPREIVLAKAVDHEVFRRDDPIFRDFPGEWPVRFYTWGARWTPSDVRLAAMLKREEDALETKLVEERQRQLLEINNGVTHHIRNGLMPIVFLCDVLDRTDDIKRIRNHTLDIRESALDLEKVAIALLPSRGGHDRDADTKPLCLYDVIGQSLYRALVQFGYQATDHQVRAYNLSEDENDRRQRFVQSVSGRGMDGRHDTTRTRNLHESLAICESITNKISVVFAHEYSDVLVARPLLIGVLMHEIVINALRCSAESDHPIVELAIHSGGRATGVYGVSDMPSSVKVGTGMLAITVTNSGGTHHLEKWSALRSRGEGPSLAVDRRGMGMGMVFMKTVTAVERLPLDFLEAEYHPDTQPVPRFTVKLSLPENWLA